MNLLELDAVSYATNLGQTAAADLARLLWLPDDEPSSPIVNWYAVEPGATDLHLGELDLTEGEDGELLLLQIEMALEALGREVCRQGIDRGEWLWREAMEQGLDMPELVWEAMAPERRLVWETFVDVTRQAHRHLRAQQKALESAQRDRAPAAPATLKREDSIFEDAPGLGDLQPERARAVNAFGTYPEPAREARERQEAEDRAKFNGADPAAFDHDGDGRPGGSRPAGPALSPVEKSIARHQRRQGAKPAPMSVGEAPVKPPQNKGGRGRRKAEKPPSSTPGQSKNTA